MSETETVCSVCKNHWYYTLVIISVLTWVYTDYLLKTVRSEVLTGVTMKSNTFWNVIPFSLVEANVSEECTTSPQEWRACRASSKETACCLLTLYPKDKSSTFLQNTGKLLRGYIRAQKTSLFLKAPLSGSLSALAAIFKWQHIPAVAVLSYF